LETGISQKTVWRILKQDLGMRPYHIKLFQALTEDQKSVGVELIAEQQRC
jgi:hypothetical protein